jgi:hypothetical protein
MPNKPNSLGRRKHIELKFSHLNLQSNRLSTTNPQNTHKSAKMENEKGEIVDLFVLPCLPKKPIKK